MTDLANAGGLGVRSPGTLAWLPRIRTRQISPENPTGERNAGARAVPDPTDPDLPHSKYSVLLGPGYKVRPFISIGVGATATLAEIGGAGVITNLFITSNADDLRDLWLRAWWDGDETPAIEVTLASFFCLGGSGQRHEVTSAAINVGPVRGCSSAWAMPFLDGAILTLENRGSTVVDVVAYKVTHEERAAAEIPDQRFRAKTVSGEPREPSFEFDLIDAAGSGIIVGTSISWTAMRPRWWGEGEVKVYFGDDEYPTIVDTGTEDYFGGAWGFGRDTTYLAGGAVGERAYNGVFTGAPYLDSNEGYPREIVLYRWHINDPIGFEDGVRMAVQVIGQGPEGTYELRDDRLTATGYWYEVVGAPLGSGEPNGE